MAAKIATLTAVTVAAAGTAQPLSATSLPVNSIIVQAATANTGNVFIGDSTVSATNGITLIPGETYSITITAMGRTDEIDTATVYVDAATNGDKVRVSVIRRS